MTRAEKIKKLSNAIKEYRGSHRPDPNGGVGDVLWVRAPKPSALSRVQMWMLRLGAEWDDEVKARIDGFQTCEAFYEFLREMM